MKEFFARLNPTERRFVVGVIVVFVLVINIVWIWPHFGDWSETKGRMGTASDQLAKFQSGTNLIPDLEKKIAKFQGQGQIVPSADQAVQFVRLIQNQLAQFGIIPENMNNQRMPGATNSFFVDQAQTMTLQTTEKQLVDFLYSLGANTNSSIRVKVLTVQPDPSHQRLTARVTLVASYQKKAIGSVGAAPAAATAPKHPETKPAATHTNTAAKPAPGPITKPAAITNRVATNHPPTLPPNGTQKNLTPTKK
jgi:hypothetical protein